MKSNTYYHNYLHHSNIDYQDIQLGLKNARRERSKEFFQLFSKFKYKLKLLLSQAFWLAIKKKLIFLKGNLN